MKWYLLLLAAIVLLPICYSQELGRIEPIRVEPVTRELSDNSAFIEIDDASFSVDKFTAKSNEQVKLDISSVNAIKDICFEFPIDTSLISISEFKINGFLWDTDLKKKEVKTSDTICYSGVDVKSDNLMYRIKYNGFDKIKYNIVFDGIVLDPYVIGNMSNDSSLRFWLPFNGNSSDASPNNISSQYYYVGKSAGNRLVWSNSFALRWKNQTKALQNDVNNSQNGIAVSIGANLKFNLSSYYDLEQTNIDLNNATNPITVNGGGYTSNITAKINTYSYNTTPSNGYLSSTIGNLKLNSTNFSISFWFYPQAANDIILECEVSNDCFRLTNSTSKLVIGAGSAGSFTSSSASTQPILSKWQMITLTYDSANLFRLYINGTADVTFSKVSSRPLSHTIGFGKDPSGSSIGGGLIDALTTWDRTLSAAEITSLYNYNRGLSYSRFTAGISSYTKQGINFNNTYYNTSYYSTAGLSNFSWCAKFNLSSNSANNYLFEQYSATLTNQTSPLFVLSNLSIMSNLSSGNVIGSKLNLGQTYHSCAVYNNATSTLSLYTDGILDGVNSSITPSISYGEWLIGSNNDGSVTFDGAVNSVQFYNYSLSADEVLKVSVGGNFTNNNLGESSSAIFLGGSDIVLVENENVSNFYSSKNHSYSMWAKYVSGNTTLYAQNRTGIFERDILSTSYLKSYNTTNANRYLIFNASSYNPSTWNHYTYSTGGGSSNIYINGSLINQTTDNKVYVYNTNNDDVIGAGYLKSNGLIEPNTGYVGYLDEFMIFNKSLVAIEDQQLYGYSTKNVTFNITDSIYNFTISSVTVEINASNPVSYYYTSISDGNTTQYNFTPFVNYTITLSKNGYVNRLFNFTAFNTTNSTYNVSMVPANYVYLRDEFTLGDFNISSPEFITVYIYCADQNDATYTFNVNSNPFAFPAFCNISKWRTVVQYPSDTYYRSLLPRTINSSYATIWLVNLDTTQLLQDSFEVYDLTNTYTNFNVYITKNINGVEYPITSDHADLEKKIAAYLMKGEQYTINIEADQLPYQSFGGFSAVDAGNKIIKLLTIQINQNGTGSFNNDRWIAYKENVTANGRIHVEYSSSNINNVFLNITAYNSSDATNNLTTVYSQTVTGNSGILLWAIPDAFNTSALGVKLLLIKNNTGDNTNFSTVINAQNIPSTDTIYVWNAGVLSDTGITVTVMSWIILIGLSVFILVFSWNTAGIGTIVFLLIGFMFTQMGWLRSLTGLGTTVGSQALPYFAFGLGFVFAIIDIWKWYDKRL